MKRKNKSQIEGRKSMRYRGTQCLNCGHPLDKSDIYCPNCSQLNSDKQLSAKDFFGEFLSSILVYDSRLRNTFKDLLFRPGTVTKNYVKGQRLKYANPFRFFLSVSIIYFLLESFGGFIASPGAGKIFKFNPPSQETLDTLQINNAYVDMAQLSPKDTLKAKALGIKFYFSEKELDTLPFMENYGKRSSLYTAYYYKNKIENPVAALDSLDHTNTFLHRWLYNRTIATYKITRNPDDFVNYVKAKIPFFLFFFTPFYALFFWLFYSRKKYTYMEHIIFIFHIFSFVFLSLVILRIPELLLGISFLLPLFFIFIGPVYFYLALLKFYRQGKGRTFLKFVLLSIVFFVSFFMATGIFVTASAAVY